MPSPAVGSMDRSMADLIAGSPTAPVYGAAPKGRNGRPLGGIVFQDGSHFTPLEMVGMIPLTTQYPPTDIYPQSVQYALYDGQASSYGLPASAKKPCCGGCAKGKGCDGKSDKSLWLWGGLALAAVYFMTR